VSPNSARAALVRSGPRTDLGDALIDAVRSRGIELEGVDGAAMNGRLVLVVMADDTATVEVPSDAEAVLPVSLLGRPAHGVPEELSQLIVSGPADVERVASRVASAIRFGPDRIVRWNRLCVMAQDRAAGRDRVPPLGAKEADDAAELLALFGAVDDAATASAVRSYLDESRRLTERRRRRIQAVGAGVVLAMASVSVFAAVQARAAVRGRHEAETQLAASTAHRLADQATLMLDEDPDLPTLLVSRATELQPDSAYVLAAAAKVSARVPPHLSIALPDRVVGLSAASAVPQLAVWLRDGTVLRYDSTSGAALGTLQAEPPDLTTPYGFELSPDGTYLAVSAADGRFEVVGQDGEVVAAGAGLPAFWFGEGQLAVLADDLLGRFDVTFQTTTSVLRGSGSLAACAISADRSRLACSDLQQVVVADAASGEAVRTLDVAGVSRLALSSDGSTVATAPSLTFMTLGEGADSDSSTDVFVEGATSVVAVSATRFAIGGSSGTIAVTKAQSLPEVEFPAHPNQAATVQVTSAGEVASAADDGYLRIWRTAATTVWGATDLSWWPMDERDPSVTARNQIVPTDDGRVIAVVGRSNVYELVRDGQVLTETDTASSGLGTVIVPQPGGRALVATGPYGTIAYDIADGLQARTEVLTDDRSTYRYTFGISENDPVPVVLAGSPGVKAFVVASADTLLVVSESTPDGTVYVRTSPQTALAATVDDDGTSTVVTSDGQLLRDSVAQRGEEGRLTGPLTVGATFSAATFIDASRIVLATSEGALIEVDGGREREVMPPGRVLDAYAVRVDADGRRAAVITATGATVVELDSGRILLHIPALAGAGISDVAFDGQDPGRVAFVTSTGGVGTLELEEGDAYGSTAPWSRALQVPRSFTADELDRFALRGGVGG